ncbi:hypothetical protein B0T20DRAFT_418308 [Sordaria brevicollis]|uniref:Uncharacterized protein n=1 Tax=Sordaria brevicollis TaxID=83679 RepID=A0AAE0PB62_SORBR|nr:hypothetical protein B0T20DRAFT_418308 [Sordaria brevicollis]
MGLCGSRLSTPSSREHHYGPTRASFGIPGTMEDCPEPQQPRRHQNGGGGGDRRQQHGMCNQDVASHHQHPEFCSLELAMLVSMLTCYPDCLLVSLPVPVYPLECLQKAWGGLAVSRIVLDPCPRVCKEYLTAENGCIAGGVAC